MTNWLPLPGWFEEEGTGLVLAPRGRPLGAGPGYARLRHRQIGAILIPVASPHIILDASRGQSTPLHFITNPIDTIGSRRIRRDTANNISTIPSCYATPPPTIFFRGDDRIGRWASASETANGIMAGARVCAGLGR
jgi:hypothetical protein